MERMDEIISEITVIKEGIGAIIILDDSIAGESFLKLSACVARLEKIALALQMPEHHVQILDKVK